MIITYRPAHVLVPQWLVVITCANYFVRHALFYNFYYCNHVIQVIAGLDSNLEDVPASKIHHLSRCNEVFNAACQQAQEQDLTKILAESGFNETQK